MASQSCTTYGKSSVIRGHHVYKAIWTPIVGENLSLQLEEENEHDNHAVVGMSDNTIVGQMLRSLSCFSCFFLRRGGFTGHRQFGDSLYVHLHRLF